MGEHVIKLPDVGEGVAEAELVEWHVKVGDLVREDTVLAAVMTDKATVEIPSPVDGEILWLGAEIGDTVAIGSPIVRLKVAGEGNVKAAAAAAPEVKAPAEPVEAKPAPAASKAASKPAEPPKAAAAPKATRPASISGAPRAEGEKPLASPAVRLRAKEAGIDLRQVLGSGPAGRISHEDLNAFVARGPQLTRAIGLA
ncbi:2-oxo acid dehydrogenase subunit E2, partial [Mesorhizobium sp. M2D.F.Ca.ET.223.01.1.1]|uniref:biotin/lipoyl-containing protein n=1 Tax=Mesorhizobium sp. M2D.F.Ca.ET.223.01.1.1 TaxID=2563940 RepID=UPI0011364D4B